MKLTRKLFWWIFRKTLADIIHNHKESIQIRNVIEVNKSVNRVYIESLEFIIADIDKYFTLGSGLSARKIMRDMRDFCSHKLETLKKLLTEYENMEEQNENLSTQ